MLLRAAFPLSADVEAEEVEALVDVDDAGLLRRQRSPIRRLLVTERDCQAGRVVQPGVDLTPWLLQIDWIGGGTGKGVALGSRATGRNSQDLWIGVSRRLLIAS
jgi:hypothetical protein